MCVRFLLIKLRRAEPVGPEWDLLVQVLADLGRHGQRVGAVLAAETGSESGADLARLIQEQEGVAL